MAELMMLNKDYSAGKSSLTRESQVLPLGKDYGKTKAGEKDSASLDFSNFLRASKEEGEKREDFIFVVQGGTEFRACQPLSP